MDGYSVTEAASVLGVPTERVWELLARGVLSGTPEGDTGMRVFLQPRPAPSPAPVGEPQRTNGHGDASREAEASPFRELLTEFRNLTERYGQALLALGEARGEVASLRSRVDVLEARMDLRLPFGGMPVADAPRARPAAAAPAPAPTPTPMPAPAPAHEEAPAPQATPVPAAAPNEPAEAEPAALEPSAEPMEAPRPETPVDAEGESDTETERAARRRRSRAHFVEDFAQALARAEDPNPAELPEAHEAAPVVADTHRETAPDGVTTVDAPDAALPRELPSAEPMIEPELEPEEAPPLEPASEATADADFATDVAEPAAEAEAEVTELDLGGAEPEPEGVQVDDVQAEVLDEAQPEPEPEAAPSSTAAAEVAAEASETDASVSAEAVAGQAATGWDQDRYTAVIEEPDWWTPDAAGWDDPLPEPQAAEDESAHEAAGPEITESNGLPEAETEAGAESSEPEAEPVEAATDASASPAPTDEEPEEPTAAAAADSAGAETEFAASMGLDTPLDAAGGEETMLWFGSRPSEATPSDWPAEDPASEMEIAATGSSRRAPGVPSLPGSDELDAALTALAHGGPSAAEDDEATETDEADDDASAAETSSTTPPGPAAPASPTVAGTDSVLRSRQVELPSPASRAYRRLRRIFPG